MQRLTQQRAAVTIATEIRRRVPFLRQDLATFLRIERLEQEQGYLVTLRLLTEKRHIETITERYHGQQVPPGSGMLSNIWELPSTPPSGWESKREVLPIPGSGSVSVCSVCDGSGTYLCLKCNGAGTSLCDRCDGVGSRVCASCYGEGVRYLGSTPSQCFSCNGTGRQRCYHCNGSGRLVCGNCGGRGRIVCSSCRGAGRLFRYQAVVCDFEPHRWDIVVSSWTLPPNELDLAEGIAGSEAPLNQKATLLAPYPQKVQEATAQLEQTTSRVLQGETRLIKDLLSVKVVPIAYASFRFASRQEILQAWLLGKDFGRVYLPNLPSRTRFWLIATFPTPFVKSFLWGARLDGLTIVSLLMGSIGLYLVHWGRAIYSPTDLMAAAILFGGMMLWGISALMTFLRRWVWGLALLFVGAFYAWLNAYLKPY